MTPALAVRKVYHNETLTMKFDSSYIFWHFSVGAAASARLCYESYVCTCIVLPLSSHCSSPLFWTGLVLDLDWTISFSCGKPSTPQFCLFPPFGVPNDSFCYIPSLFMFFFLSGGPSIWTYTANLFSISLQSCSFYHSYVGI